MRKEIFPFAFFGPAWRLCFPHQTDLDAFIVSFAEISAETFLVLLASFQNEAGKNNGKSLAHGKRLRMWRFQKSWHQMKNIFVAPFAVEWGYCGVRDWLHRRRSNCCWSQITENIKIPDNQNETFAVNLRHPRRHPSVIKKNWLENLIHILLNVKITSSVKISNKPP